jgi:hypothetical protein
MLTSIPKIPGGAKAARPSGAAAGMASPGGAAAECASASGVKRASVNSKWASSGRWSEGKRSEGRYGPSRI